jgi:hypothetical protein
MNVRCHETSLAGNFSLSGSYGRNPGLKAKALAFRLRLAGGIGRDFKPALVLR